MKNNKKYLNDEEIENVTGGVSQVTAMNDTQTMNDAPADLENASSTNQLASPLSDQVRPQKDDGNRGKVNTKNPG